MVFIYYSPYYSRTPFYFVSFSYLLRLLFHNKNISLQSQRRRTYFCNKLVSGFLSLSFRALTDPVTLRVHLPVISGVQGYILTWPILSLLPTVDSSVLVRLPPSSSVSGSLSPFPQVGTSWNDRSNLWHLKTDPLCPSVTSRHCLETPTLRDETVTVLTPFVLERRDHLWCLLLLNLSRRPSLDQVIGIVRRGKT